VLLGLCRPKRETKQRNLTQVTESTVVSDFKWRIGGTKSVRFSVGKGYQTEKLTSVWNGPEREPESDGVSSRQCLGEVGSCVH
jgi:hypothetical protein